MEDLSSNPFDSQFHSKQEYSSGDIQDLPSNSSNYTLNSTNNTDKDSDVNNNSNQGLNNLSNNSYNNIINLNLMRSKKFKEKDTDEALENKKELLKSQMNFSHKNFDTLIKEGALNKFDNVTYKTIHHEHKINPGDMEKFLANFDDVDV